MHPDDEALSAHLDGEGPQLRAHLDGCAACTARLAGLPGEPVVPPVAGEAAEHEELPLGEFGQGFPGEGREVGRGEGEDGF